MKKILIVILLIIASFILLRRLSADIFLPHLGSCIKAKITSQTMRLRYQKATYLYEFHKNEEDYENNSEIMVGSVHEDSICVLYLEEIPSVNMR